MELDALTLAGCQRGDSRAFRTLVECYGDRVYALCRALAGAGDAEDLAQETFVRVHGAIRRFDPAGAARLSTWILTIARRLCTDRARSGRLKHERQVSVETATPAGTPEDLLHRARLSARLRSAVEQLPPEQRAVVALRDWDGLEYDAIAEIEGIPVGTVRSRLSRAREALRGLLADLFESRGADVVTK